MSDPGPAAVAAPARPLRKLAYALAAIAVLAIGTGYFFYVRRKTEYFAYRNLRVLGTVADQIETALESKRGFVRNFPTWDRKDAGLPFDAKKPVVRAELTEQQKETFDLYFRGFEELTPAPCKGTKPAENVQDEFDERVVLWQGKPALQIGYRSSDGTKSACGTLPLAHLFDEAIRQPFLGLFDTVMIANGTGRVIYRAAAAHRDSRADFAIQRSGDEAATDSSAEVRVDDLSALEQKKGWNDYEALDASKILGATRQLTVMAGGTAYRLFAQPCRFTGPEVAKGVFPSSAKPKDATAEDPRGWTVCALASNRRFMYEALAISMTVLAGGAALLLLGISMWPFVRLSNMSESRPVTIADAIMLIIGTLLAAAVLTIGIADAIVYRRLEALGDRQLRQIAEQLTTQFDRDVDRSLMVLRNIEREWHPDCHVKRNSGAFENDVTSDRLRNLAIDATSTVGSFAWMDSEGWQAFKRSVGPVAPQVSVAGREYFRLAQSGRVYTTDWQPTKRDPFVVESIRSQTTGVPEVVVSKPTGDSRYPVLAVTLRVSQLINPVLPAGFGFAVLDADGRVVFHDDAQRNGVENFVEETDRDRGLRAVLSAHTEDELDIRYGGRDYRAYVLPMQGVPWTLVVLRNKDLLRTVNVETIVMALLCVAICTGVAIVLIGALALAFPRYRLPWLWPDPSRAADYARLAIALELLTAAAAVTVFLFDGTTLLLLSTFMATQAFLTAYLVLHGTPRRRGFLVAIGAWLVTTFLWNYLLRHGNAGTGLVFWESRKLAKDLITLCLLASGGVAVWRFRTPMRTHAMNAYVRALAMLIAMTAVVPVSGFFKASYGLELRNYVVHGQLAIATALQQRIEQIGAASFKKEELNLRTYANYPPFYDSSWWVEPAPAPENPKALRCPPGRSEGNTVPDFLEELLPLYSDYSIPMRELHHQRAADASWSTCIMDHNLLVLTRRSVFDPVASRKLWPAQAPRETIVATRVPTVLPSWLQRAAVYEAPFIANASTPLPRHDSSDPLLGRILRRSLYVFGFILLFVILCAASDFIARKLFLFDIREPLWLENAMGPYIGGHVFLVRRAARTSGLINHGLYRIRLARLATPDDWKVVVARIDALPAGRNVLIEDFESQSGEAWSAAKLSLLDAILARRDRMIVVTSTIPPLALIGEAADKDAWRLALGAFVWLSEDQVLAHRPRAALPQAVLPAAAAATLPQRLRMRAVEAWMAVREVWGRTIFDEAIYRADEAAGDRVLRPIVDEVSQSTHNHAQFCDEMCERADAYYAGLWTGCSIEERRLLYQLACEGLLNGQNRRMVRRLFVRGLIRRRPHVALLNESFRKYVLAAGVREQLAQVPDEPAENAYEAFSRPVAFVVVAVAVMFFSTQQNLLNTTNAVITALAGGIPTLVRLIGAIADKRLQSASS